MDAESMQKNLKIFNYTTTNAIVMKLTTDIYLNKDFHLPKSWDVTHRVKECINKKTQKMSQKVINIPYINIITIYN